MQRAIPFLPILYPVVHIPLMPRRHTKLYHVRLQAVKTGLFVARHKPSAVSESYRLSQEERNHPRLAPWDWM